MDIFDDLCEPNLAGNNDNPSVTFRCYEDNNFPTYSAASASCNDITGIGILKTSDDLIRLSPNPTSGFLRVQLVQPSTIKIFNVQGTIVFEQNLNEGDQKLDLNFLQNGIYFIEVSHMLSKTNLKFIKE